MCDAFRSRVSMSRSCVRACVRGRVCACGDVGWMDCERLLRGGPAQNGFLFCDVTGLRMPGPEVIKSSSCCACPYFQVSCNGFNVHWGIFGANQCPGTEWSCSAQLAMLGRQLRHAFRRPGLSTKHLPQLPRRQPRVACCAHTRLKLGEVVEFKRCRFQAAVYRIDGADDVAAAGERPSNPYTLPSRRPVQCMCPRQHNVTV